MGANTGRATGEADAFFLGHADARSRIDRRQPGSTEPGAPHERPLVFVSGLLGNPHGPRARRQDQEQRSCPQPISFGARVPESQGRAARNDETRRQSGLQFETPTPWDSVRHDALGETDDWAHDGRYDRMLETFTRTDDYLRQLWTWLQSQPEYRGRTHILITTDHGRGRTPKDWKDHGKDVVGAGEAAATLVRWMGFDWKTFDPMAALPVQ